MFTAKPRNNVLNGRTTKNGRRAHASRCLPQKRNPPSYARSVSAAIFRVRKPSREPTATKDVTPGKNQYPPSESSETLRCGLPCQKTLVTRLQDRSIDHQCWCAERSKPLRLQEREEMGSAANSAARDRSTGWGGGRHQYFLTNKDRRDRKRCQRQADTLAIILAPSPIPLEPSENPCRLKGACHSHTCPASPCS